jgi:predicted permease
MRKAVFAVFTYTGNNPASKIPSDILAGAVGAVACLILAAIGAAIRRWVRRQAQSSVSRG